MKKEQIEERLEKAQDKLNRKKNTIEKKTLKIKKETDDFEIEWLKQDIKRLNREVEETETLIEKYQRMLKEAKEKEHTLTSKMPEVFKELQKQLVKEWNEFDKNRRESLRKEYKELGYDEFFRKHGRAGWELKNKSDEEINKDNVRDSENLVIDLYNRVHEITGEIKTWSNIRMDYGTHGFPILTGYVKGKNGTAKVESIFAGGYNIQRLHIRVLVHKI